ncbi:MAG TPA: hypothetical protein PLT43_03880 [Mesotoga sp.]|jgi:hypothetical protein|nr:hypothetical protein [Mesotoga sp.]
MRDWKYFAALNNNLLESKYATQERARDAITKFEQFVKNGLRARNMHEDEWYYFCPITGKQCRTDCVCFKEHSIIPRSSRQPSSSGAFVEEKWFSVKNWECTNVQVSGIVYIERI